LVYGAKLLIRRFEDAPRPGLVPGLLFCTLLRRKFLQNMALSATLNLASPRTKQEADAMALKLFCLLAFLLVGLITAGVL
jgi:hypothetical protein